MTWACAEWPQNVCQATFVWTERALPWHCARTVILKLGYMVTTQKPTLSHCSGCLQHPQGQRKQDKWGEKSKWSWQFCFFNYRGVVYHEHAQDGQTVNKQYYQVVLGCLCDAVCCKSRTCGTHALAVASRQCPRPFFASDPEWPNIEFPRLVTLLTLQTCLLLTSGCSPSWQCHWKGPDSELRGNNAEHNSTIVAISK